MNQRKNASGGDGIESLIAGIGALAGLGYAAYQVYQATQAQETVKEKSNGAAPRTSNVSFANETVSKNETNHHDWIATGVKKIIVIDKESDYDVHRKDLNDFIQEAKALGAVGLDVEWMNYAGVTSPPPCLLQLATYKGTCLLIRLRSPRSLNDKTRRLLADPDIIKAGVGISEDCNRLWDLLSVNTRGWVELDHLDSIPGRSLNAMSSDVLGVTLGKNRTYDWNAPEYTQSQISYAALDANVSMRLLIALASSQTDFEPDRFERALQAARHALESVCDSYLEKVVNRRRMIQ